VARWGPSSPPPPAPRAGGLSPQKGTGGVRAGNPQALRRNGNTVIGPVTDSDSAFIGGDADA